MFSYRLVALIGLLAALALIVPTLAAPPNDSVSSDVTLTTDNSTNAAYVRPTDDGDITLDLSPSNPALAGNGVNSDAVIYVADAFRIRYGADGDGTVTVWLGVDTAGITFQSRGQPVDSPADAIELTPGDAAPIGFVVDTTAGTLSSETEFTVHANVTKSNDGTQLSGSGGGSPGAITDEPESEPPVTVKRLTDERRRILFRDAVAGQPVSADLDRLIIDRAGTGVTSLGELTVRGNGGDHELEVGVADAESLEPLPADARPLGAVEVNERVGTVEDATLQFDVDRDYLDETGLSVDELRLFRYDEGERSELDLAVAARTEGHLVLEAETPGFSTFVVAADVEPEPSTPGPTPAEPPTGTAAPDAPETGPDGAERVGTPAEPPSDTPVAPDGSDEPAAVDTNQPVAEPAGGFGPSIVWLAGALALLALVAAARRLRDDGGT